MKTNASSARKAIWVIGAGASVSDTDGHFPTLLQIPGRARELGLITEDFVSEPELKGLAGYLKKRLYGDLTNPAEAIDLEHVLSLLEIDIAVSPEPNLLFARKAVLRLLRSTLLRLSSSAPPLQGHYKRMVASLGPRDTVITFNWDTLLDDVFGRVERLANAGANEQARPKFGRQSNRYDRFLMQLTGWGERTIHGASIPPPVHSPEDVGYFIKAHGSVDWYYCTNPGCRAHETVFPMLGSKTRPVCSGCRERTEVLIIPPTMNKRLRDLPLTRRLLTLAAAEMGQGSEVVVWGYSLPPTDFFSEWILRHAKSTRCKRLVLINPDVFEHDNGVTRLNAAFISRFVRTLSRPGRTIQLEVYSNFNEFEASSSAAMSPGMTAQLRRLARGQVD